MKFEWDEHKNILNQKKHGIRFEEAIQVFYYEFTVAFDENHSSLQEDRYWAVGRIPRLGITVVVFTEVYDDIIRIISARKATHGENKIYEKT